MERWPGIGVMLVNSTLKHFELHKVAESLLRIKCFERDKVPSCRQRIRQEVSSLFA